MKSSIYEYRDYKKHLTDLIETDPNGGRGKRKALAEAIGCQVSHITNVLSGGGHFSQEQAEAAARFFGLNKGEIEFLLILVQYNRAGTSTLRKFYEGLLDEKTEKYSALKNRLKMPDSLKLEQETRYYSSWQYGAVHVLLSIKEFQTRDAISTKLNLSLSKTDEILSFLTDAGLCKKEGQKYLLLRPLLHLDKSSPLISKHHINWRLRGLLALDANTENQLHYSSVFTVSTKDFDRVREVLSNALTAAFKIITPSAEEEGAVICLDLFKL